MVDNRYRMSDELHYHKVIIAMQDEVTGRIQYVAGRARAVDIQFQRDFADVGIFPGGPIYAVPTSHFYGKAVVDFVELGMRADMPDFNDIKTPEEIENPRKAIVTDAPKEIMP